MLALSLVQARDHAQPLDQLAQILAGLHQFDPVPQLLKNVRFAGGKPLDHADVKRVIAQAEAELNGAGRLVIRPSGTEPVIRVMAEGDSEDQVKDVVERICAAVEKAAA